MLVCILALSQTQNMSKVTEDKRHIRSRDCTKKNSTKWTKIMYNSVCEDGIDEDFVILLKVEEVISYC